jgi:type II secretory pathway pseudopilin PulG
VTLLEAFASLVILGASAAGFLGVFQNAARSVQSAAEWNHASATAASAIDQAVRESTTPADPMTPDANTRVETRPWSSNVNDVVVQVALPDGRMLTVHRLVRQR